ncbi:MAG: metal-dependent hydrolase [Nevskia sp.]
MMPVRRDLHFDLSKTDLKRWNGNGPLVSHYMNALSVFFPEGERFFIHSLRHYRDRITDPELKKAITAFIGQEAMHGREHEEYNERLAAAGLPVARLGKIVTFMLEKGFKRLPNAAQLSITIALEHFTAIYADLLLKEPRLLQGADPALAAMWRWHALEETEHKGVAFDAYTAVMGRGLKSYALRTATQIAITALFLTAIVAFHIRIVRADRSLRTGVRDWAKFTWFMLGPVGALRRLALPWLDYFKPGFHPWDHANQHYLEGIDAFVKEIEALPQTA